VPTPHPAEAESEAVLAFMRDHQGEVLRGAIADIADCPTADLPQVAHAWFGTLGSYQLHAAGAEVSALQAAVRAADVTPERMEQARAEALAALREIEADGPR
jgi:hypothetical protein